MMWLGLRARVKISALEERLEKLEESFRMLDLEMTDRVDRLNGIAKRIQGRRGGRPPTGEANGEDNSEAENSLGELSRHIL